MTRAEALPREQFDDLAQQHEADALGMWVFLATEVLFFGGLFLVYIVYRWRFPAVFDAASNHLHVGIGTVNTMVLLVSSFTMALGVYFAQAGRRTLLCACLLATALLGSVFLGLKVWEWTLEIGAGLVPGSAAIGHGPERAVAQLFIWLYFAMTGLHGLHMAVAVALVLIVAVQAARGRYTPEDHATVEVVGLYWHYVDLVWIFLYPLLYLGGRHLHPAGG